jgi:VanZ family protein
MSVNADRSRTPPLSLSRQLWYWLPPLLWMAAILWFSTDNFSAQETGSLLEPLLRWLLPQIAAAQIETAHFLVRKAGHFTVYAALALLLMRAFRAGSPVRWRRRWALASLLIVSLYALLDEYHQSFTEQRTAAVSDSLIDICGGLVSVGMLWLIRGRSRR